jgi:hypothetical protein
MRLPDGAVVDEVSSESVRGVRLRLAECHAPAFLFLIPIESASTAEVLSRSFTPLDYKMIDVYRGEIQQEWSHVNRVFNYVLARAEAVYWTKSQDADAFYVRIYISGDCQPETHVLIGWASTVLAQWL